MRGFFGTCFALAFKNKKQLILKVAFFFVFFLHVALWWIVLLLVEVSRPASEPAVVYVLYLSIALLYGRVYIAVPARVDSLSDLASQEAIKTSA